MYQRIERPLIAREIRSLNAHIGRARRERRAVAQFRPLAGAGLFMLGAASLMGWFTGRSLSMSVLFALLFILAMTPIAIFGNRNRRDREIDRYRNILATNRAIVHVVHVVQAQDCIKFAEREDEGDLWMFQVSPDQLVILQGQAYYETRRFPALNFEIIEMGDLPIMIRTRSEKISPRESIPASGRDLLPQVEGVLMTNGRLGESTRALDSLARRA